LRREEVDRLNEKLTAAAKRENELTLRLQSLTVARADAEGALRASRAENEAALQELGAQRESRTPATNAARPSAVGDQMLRQAIIRLGRRLASGSIPDLSGSGEAEIIAFNPRDPIGGFDVDDEPSRRATHASEV
jgi:hypothetical protein